MLLSDERTIRVIRAFQRYENDGNFELRRWKRQFESLSEQHRQVLHHIPSKCERAKSALQTNQNFFNLMLMAIEPTSRYDNLNQNSNEEELDTHPSDIEKVKYVLKNLVRDWSQEGASERHATYSSILTELKSYFYQWCVFGAKGTNLFVGKVGLDKPSTCFDSWMWPFETCRRSRCCRIRNRRQ